jgi:hypothetical protein
MVESQPSKLLVAGPIPVSRSIPFGLVHHCLELSEGFFVPVRRRVGILFYRNARPLYLPRLLHLHQLLASALSSFAA